MKPTLYITSASAIVQARRNRARPETLACVGPDAGKQISIISNPKVERGEAGLGWCPALCPEVADKLAVKLGDMESDHFRRVYLEEVVKHPITPGKLIVSPWDSDWPSAPVRDGDTLTCVCGKKRVKDGLCHRPWAAMILVAAGWRVILDGTPIDGIEDEPDPVLRSMWAMVGSMIGDRSC